MPHWTIARTADDPARAPRIAARTANTLFDHADVHGVVAADEQPRVDRVRIRVRHELRDEVHEQREREHDPQAREREVSLTLASADAPQRLGDEADQEQDDRDELREQVEPTADLGL